MTQGDVEKEVKNTKIEARESALPSKIERSKGFFCFLLRKRIFCSFSIVAWSKNEEQEYGVIN